MSKAQGYRPAERRAPSRPVALLTALALAACATAPPPQEHAPASAEAATMALRLDLVGTTGALFPDGDPIPVELTPAGGSAPVTIALQEGTLAAHDLPPGAYAVSRIGPLACAGIGFELTPGDGPQVLGTLQARLVQTDYDIALISARRAGPADLAAMGAGARQGRLAVHRQALCHAGRGGPGTEFHDLSPTEQVLAVLLFAGFCAAAVASGGVCNF